LGFLICALLYGNIVNALDINIPSLTTKDLFAMAALSGLLSHGNTEDKPNTMDYYSSLAWKYSDLMVQKRSR
jgi:hypothetical protein